MKLNELRPGMENLELEVDIISIGEPREVETYSGLKHTLVEGEVRVGIGLEQVSTIIRLMYMHTPARL